MSKAQRIMIGVLGSVLTVVAVLTLNSYRQNQREQSLRAQLALKKGMALYERGHYDLALQEFGRVEPGVTTDWRLPYYLGAANVRLKDYSKAAEHLERARALNQGEPEILYLLGIVYFKLGDLSLAKGYFTATLDIEPSHEQARGLMDVMSGLIQVQDQPGKTGESSTESQIP